MKIQTDKIKHFTVCVMSAAIVSFIVALLSKNVIAAVFAGASAGMALGIGKEYGDEAADNNFWDWKDVKADALGALVGSLTGFIALII